MKTLFNHYSNIIRIAIVFFVIVVFSCSGDKQPDYTSLTESKKGSVNESLNTQEEKKLAALFTGSLSESLDSLMKVYKKRFSFHGNVLVSYHGMLTYSKAFGTADFREHTPLQLDSRFQLASVSKQFTAVAIMMLVDQGALSYSDTVQNILPRFPYGRVTIEQLLHHTAGMPNYMWLLEHKWERGKSAYNDDVIRLMDEHNTNLYFRPGYRYDYSNTGYVVLARVVEKISGQRFADFMQENVFAPLEMNDTFIYSNALDRNYPKRLQGYYRRWGRYNVIKETVHDGIVGDKNVYSTVMDLYKWDQALYEGELLPKEKIERAFKPVKVRGKWEYPYGYGFRIKKVNDKKVVYHTGLWEGFKPSFMRYIEDRNTIIILNHTNINVNSILVKKIENLMNQKLETTPVQKVVNITIKEGYEAGLKSLRKLRKSDEDFDFKKILKAAELLSDMGKPQLAGVLIRLYRKAVSSMNVADRSLE
ncbi:MAG: beta-lactamase family protein [Bacteroidales bacterium]|nr:beta-lactamase family protein [Bacteroidales bacterium]MCF8338522.1 beta-lactamase family protein [Bacteroidales bacterium]